MKIKNFSQNSIILFNSISISASSGNSAELTTIKNLKRTKNKGRKKKAKTKQCQTQSNVKIEPEQECKPQDNKSNSDITTTQITEQITELSSNTPQPDEVAVAVDENGATDIQTAGKFKQIISLHALVFFCSAWLHHLNLFLYKAERDTSQKVSS